VRVVLAAAAAAAAGWSRAAAWQQDDAIRGRLRRQNALSVMDIINSPFIEDESVETKSSCDVQIGLR